MVFDNSVSLHLRVKGGLKLQENFFITALDSGFPSPKAEGRIETCVLVWLPLRCPRFPSPKGEGQIVLYLVKNLLL